MTDPIRTAARVLGALRRLVVERRGGQSYASAAAEIGIGKATLHDFEHGRIVDPSMDIVLKLLRWITPEEVVVPAVPDMFTPAARRLLDALQERHGLGQAWMRIEPGLLGLVIPDAEGTLGELAHIGSFTHATWRECSRYIRRGTVALMPAYRGPRNRATYDHGYPITLTNPQPHAHLGTTDEGDDTDGLQGNDDTLD